MSSNFYYKKPSISFDKLQKATAVLPSRRYSTWYNGLSKTKTHNIISKMDANSSSNINKSVLPSSDTKKLFNRQSSGLRVYQRSPHASPKRPSNYSSQVNKLSPRSLMSNKSKEILYKNFLKEFKTCTQNAQSKHDSLCKQDLYEIMKSMSYFPDTSIPLTESEQRSINYLYRLCKHWLPNLKIILLWLESFYIIHKAYTSQKVVKEKPFQLVSKVRYPFGRGATSPDQRSKPKLMKFDGKFSPRCQSPKSSMIKYDSDNHIIEVPEEYEEFLRRKFSKLCSNRASRKKYDYRSNKSVIKNHSTIEINSKDLSVEYDSNYGCKGNQPGFKAKQSPTRANITRRNNTLKSLTKTFISREVEAKNMKGFPISKNKTRTPKTFCLKSSQSTPKMLMTNCSRRLFQKILSQTPSQERNPQADREASQKALIPSNLSK